MVRRPLNEIPSQLINNKIEEMLPVIGGGTTIKQEN